ncbi:M16 family metallopeptidase [Sphingomonas arantia]|uniref:M16 family metallopeptidase n=1 Tax=Sphingomonas arantia TaxID=1460676 RepID=A0ABW4TSS7_9SPHN
MRKHGLASMRSILISLFVFSSSGLTADRAPAPDSVSSGSTNRPSSDRSIPAIGRLGNGVRFAILPRHGNEPGVALLMRNEGGFIAEHRPGERGLAHLIEHVVFHSPTVGSPDDLDHFTRVGLQLTLPAPHVATTSWRESNYFLSSKTAQTGDLDSILALLREAASDLTFRPDSVDGQRTSVMQEMAAKKLGNEIYASYIAAVAPGSPNDVIDAQNSDDVPTASIDTIRGLYQRLYRPENMVIVVVGNVKVDETRALIEKRFRSWKRTQPSPRHAPFPMFERDRIRPISFSALPQGRRTALVAVVMPTPAPPSSRDRQARADIMDLLVTRAINDRLVALQPNSPRGKVGMFIENGEQGHRQIMLWDNYIGDQWELAVAGLRKTACDLATSGFTPKEWATAKRNLVADLEHRTAEMPKVANVDLAKDLSHALADGRYLIPADELLRYARATLLHMDARSGSRWWRQQWRNGVEHLRVEAPELAKVTSPVAAIRAAADRAVSARPARWPDRHIAIS